MMSLMVDAPTPVPNGPTFKWAHLARAAAKVTDAETELARMVHQARASGASWASIAEHLGVTRQAAWKRYGKPAE